MHFIREDRGIRCFFNNWRFEFYWLTGRFTVEMETRPDEGAFQFTICLALFSLYLTLNWRWMRRLARWMLRGSYDGRNIGIRIFEWAVWWECWAKSDEWSSRDPWWMRWTWHPLDTFFGSKRHSAHELSSTETLVQMPEGAYPVTVVMKAETWKRPRLPWASYTTTRAHIECRKPIPFPGKGTCEWNCGEDATHSMTTPAATVEEGVEKLRQSVLRDRTRYGGPGWRPSEAAA